MFIDISANHLIRLQLRFSIPLAALTLLFLPACSFNLAEDVTPPPGYQAPAVQQVAPTTQPRPLFPVTAPDPANGASIYAEKCAPCHGETGLGDGPQAGQLPDGAPAIGSLELARQAVPAEWFQVITDGRLDRFMPPFSASLSTGQRWDVLSYVLSLNEPPEAVSQGETLFQENCAACHGPGGQGDGPQASTLSVNLPDFTDSTYIAQRPANELYQVLSAGVAPGMPAFESQLSEEQRWALVAYLRSFALGLGGQAVASSGEKPVAEGSQPVVGGSETTGEQLAGGEAAELPPMGLVQGQVVNGSGGDVPADLTVTLHGFDHIEEVYTISTTVKPDGSFAFPDVEMSQGRVYMVSVDYSQATYTSDLGIADGGTQTLDLPVTIYETTTDTSLLVVDRLHLFIENTAPGVLEVTELYLVSNPGDRVVIAPEEGQPVVTYQIPEGATNLRFQSDTLAGRFVEVEGGFGDTMGVPPGAGQYQVMFAYDMPYERQVDLRQKLSLPVNAVIVLMPETAMRLKSDILQDNGVREVQGQAYRVFTSGQLAAGDELVLSLSGSALATGSGALDMGSSGNLVAGLAAFGVALVVAGLWLYRRGARPGAPDAAIRPVSEPEDDRESLMDAIIALDDLYRDGKLPEDAYRRRRAELKERLKATLS